jgi:hypothetical protein
MAKLSHKVVPYGMDQTETWLPIPQTNGTHSASNLGRIRRDTPVRRYPAGYILRQYVNRYGYARIMLRRDGKAIGRAVHRMVAEAFFGPPMGMTVNHKNGIKTDNRIENLEYMTLSDNLRHASKVLNAIKRGESHPLAKLNESQILAIRALRTEGHTQQWIAKMFGILQPTVSSICSRRSWSHVA